MTPRLMTMMVLAMSVSGCATGDDPTMFTGAIKPVAPTLTADVSPDYAAAYLPQVAGRVDAVRQTSRTDHIFQTILYPNPGYSDGENQLTVSIAPPSSDKSYFQAPTQREVVREMRGQLPGVPMRIMATAGQNQNGPFGYAIGASANGGTCIFAWQTARDISRDDQTGFARFGRTRYAAKVRLRYCHPTMTEGSLVSLMAGLRIREVSEATVEMLRFAEGSGVAGRATYAIQQPEPVQKRPTALRPKAVVATASGKAKTAALPVRSGPRVLKPEELAGYKNAQASMPATVAVASKVATKPVAVKAPAIPLPGDLDR
ncbi:cellulose biosynthesis protein BcsN [Hoeflea sp. G2-23]|uniref:Cellulose biosynthesis protein BcsN n=1 Tax=Hoeflea algicola TaxID=2983763 RepID=A0ABT3ZDY2_9HYPH|nr:cellulose biosynthesis protein BcsN [Hoeflea algicola]MCY0150005.1 cellulose biosynthesis protein BcsN [Hoeflea algicola]